MCFHSRKEMIDYESNYMKAVGGDKTAWLRVTDSRGYLIGAMPVKIYDTQQMANTLRDLQHWHPESVADLSDINKARREVEEYAEPLGLRDLPKPKGRPSEPVEIVRSVERNHSSIEKYMHQYA